MSISRKEKLLYDARHGSTSAFDALILLAEEHGNYELSAELVEIAHDQRQFWSRRFSTASALVQDLQSKT